MAANNKEKILSAGAELIGATAGAVLGLLAALWEVLLVVLLLT